MSHPLDHAKSSAKLFGGKPEDYLMIHMAFDASKEFLSDWRHRALYHHTQGIFEMERRFGVSIVNSDGKDVPVRFIGEQHCNEDLGYIPTVAEWLEAIPLRGWMGDRVHRRKGAQTAAEAVAKPPKHLYDAIRDAVISHSGRVEDHDILIDRIASALGILNPHEQQR
jgi:hypothetical protein